MQYSPSLARTLQGTCAVSGLRTRSVVLAGHAPSVALEPEFWAVLDRIAARRSLSKAQLLADIDAGRGRRPLASACRLLALSWVAEHGVEM